MEIDYDKAIQLQGSWGYSPTIKELDLQTTDTEDSQSFVYQVVEESIQNNMSSTGVRYGW